MGRPPFTPTQEQRRQVQQLAAIGVAAEDIGQVISDRPVDPKTIRKHMRDELDRGAALCNVRVSRKLFELIDQGNLGAICFFLKCRAGWRESMRIETTGPDGAPLNAPTPVFYLPEKDALLPGQEPPASQPPQSGNQLLLPNLHAAADPRR